MRRSLANYTWIILLAGSLCVACSSDDDASDNVDSGTDSSTSTEITGPYTLSVDKSTIEADGEDAATLILTDANGNVLTDSKQLNYITFENVETGDALTSHTNTFTSVSNGTFEFKATYKTYESANTVTITAQNRGKYEKYYRKVVAYDVTNVACTYCPDMTAALEGVAQTWGEHLVIFAIHGPFSASDPWLVMSGTSYVGSTILSKFGGSGYPFCVINLNHVMASSERNSNSVGRIIQNQLINYPATCGIKIASSYSNGTVTLSGSLTSETGDTYDLGYAILSDNQTYGGTEYNDIVVAISSNFYTMSSGSKFTVAAGEEHTTDFTVSGVDASTVAEYGLENMRVAVFAMRDVDGTIIVDNIAECPLGEDLDYQIND